MQDDDGFIEFDMAKFAQDGDSDFMNINDHLVGVNVHPDRVYMTCGDCGEEVDAELPDNDKKSRLVQFYLLGYFADTGCLPT